MSKAATFNQRFLEVQEEQARELRRIGRESAEQRKILNKMFLIMRAQEVARLEENGNLTPAKASGLETD